MAQFRRPASLSPQRQEAIEGGVDPALRNEAAHESAAALLHEFRDGASADTVERVLHLVDNEGLDDLAELWSLAEPASLPGALWRLYVLHTWIQRDPGEVKDRFEAGRSSAPGLQYLAGFPEPPTVDGMKATADDILSGAFVGDLSIALRRASAIAMLTAYGTAHGADDPSGTLAAHRLLSMGEALEAASRSAHLGTLE